MSDLRRSILLTLAIFALSLAAGVLITLRDPTLTEQFLEMFKDAILGEINDNEPVLLTIKLLLNNLQACIFMFLGGVSLGVITALIIITNGLVIGSIVELVREQQGSIYIMAALIPHGIFEIPAFVISGALGFLLARALWFEWYGMDDAASTAAGLGRTFLTVVVPLVIIAAFTEAFITPEIIRFLASGV